MIVTEEVAYNLLGAIGAGLVLFGFYRTSIGRWTNKTLWYELDNILGPICLIIYSAHYQAYISIVVNAVWIAVAFRGLIPFAERYGKRLRRKVKAKARASALARRRAHQHHT